MACEYKGRYSLAELEVVQQDVPNILGFPTCTQMKMMKRIDSVQHKSEDIFEELKDMFDGLGCIKNTQHHLYLLLQHILVSKWKHGYV